ncbi:quinone oxidoreductase family protein [Paraurantiacibacter namhicola]|uniref:Quinone oxidoreductase 1 n=1 Tax=Paraurantiacibacter namhicola TaxID=645517 RepID=A0A1C7D4G8_9SPHN|nr:quinone oxidoreductase [Paraurantiacibacter namhicola]ANU06357.1 Quinone oxidoreductase 1 [Paraurantiacibacter namhicola]
MRTTRAILRAHGGPEAIEWVQEDLPDPGPGEVLLEHGAVGLNYIDTYHRRGIYPMELPGGLGIEAAGRVLAVGEGVEGFAAGDRAATFGPLTGAYATHRLIAAEHLFALPGTIDDRTAAAAIVKAFTAEFLVERCAKVEAGWPVLVHAAAGGTGLLLVQWLKHIGAEVIGTVSTEDKAQAAREAGADHIIFYKREDTAARVREITGGAGVRVTFDGIGRSTWETSLDATGMRGLIVNYGNADAPVGEVDVGVLAMKGSLFNTRPMLFHYYADPEERARCSARVWDLFARGVLSVTVGQEYALTDAAQAHADLESGKTTGSTLLLP